MYMERGCGRFTCLRLSNVHLDADCDGFSIVDRFTTDVLCRESFGQVNVFMIDVSVHDGADELEDLLTHTMLRYIG